MGIYDRALQGQKMIEQQATGMLGLSTPPMTPARPPLPSTDVGNVDFESAINAQRNIESQQDIQAQQEAIGSLVSLLQTGTNAFAFGGRDNPADEAPGGYRDIYGSNAGRGILQGSGVQTYSVPDQNFGNFTRI
jgi:hypothetical protein